ncbi:branched-chain amino acid ABC transporter substrate-binding protein [Paracoccus sp. S-4012]|uniref:ABC transporter substrate-binding protein n=1 Tax=Paracoccus sp. S-4012 TaxID=2665648 RepID=UPI0012B0F2EC|nr:ABC transporter substrate-binding protein [Paracoccus sp. S-4012]MRX51544.1 branched-chain amino acid ABC transporter substrate-binding protein [Paracoccus sp. S-4012]
MRAIAAVVSVAFGLAAGMAAAAEGEVRAAVLRVDVPAQPPISRLDARPDDLGFAGAALATEDNATTGGFLNQTFTTGTVAIPPEGAEAALDALLAQGIRFIAVLADDATTLRLADRAGDAALILNAGAEADALRNDDCRANVIHVAPSRAMKTDALAQFLMWKRWPRWFLIEGSHPEDTALADAYRRAASKFGAKIVEQRVFEDTGGARRTDSGHVQVQAQMPVFTQRAAEHDVVVTADEHGVFAAYLPFQTWDPRPVTGSAGLTPVSWHASMEAWGATQFQNRFEALAGRPMRPEDYQTWVALRLLGEAASRAPALDFPALRDWLLGPNFEIGAFKGQKLTIRDWDHQLRQPILLASPALVHSVSPQSEYLHQVSQLDTLGTDRPESTCQFQ